MKCWGVTLRWTGILLLRKRAFSPTKTLVCISSGIEPGYMQNIGDEEEPRKKLGMTPE